jgi:hypothetical protein
MDEITEVRPLRNWVHNCPKCHFIGNWDLRSENPTSADGVYDLYTCQDGVLDLGLRAVARYGNDPKQFHSLPLHSVKGLFDRRTALDHPLMWVLWVLSDHIEKEIKKQQSRLDPFMYAHATQSTLHSMDRVVNGILQEACIRGDNRYLDRDLYKCVTLFFKEQHNSRGELKLDLEFLIPRKM